jgi:hypothetical protein
MALDWAKMPRSPIERRVSIVGVSLGVKVLKAR